MIDEVAQGELTMSRRLDQNAYSDLHSGGGPLSASESQDPGTPRGTGTTRSDPLWLQALIAAHGAPLARMDEPFRRQRVLRRSWGWIGRSVYLDYDGDQYVATARAGGGRKATLVCRTEPTGDDMFRLLLLVGLLDPGEATA